MEGCSVSYAMEIINGKWKLLINWHIGNEKTVRFNDLQRKVNGISSLMLSKNLKELESDGLVIRRQYNEIPPRVEYELTQLGQALGSVLKKLGEWEKKYTNKITHNQKIRPCTNYWVCPIFCNISFNLICFIIEPQL